MTPRDMPAVALLPGGLPMPDRSKAISQTKKYLGRSFTLTLREEKRLQVFENKVLRKIFGPKRDDQTGEWRRLHNNELHDLYGKPDIIRIVKSHRLRWAGHVTQMGNERGAWKLLVGKPEGEVPSR